MKGYTVPLSKRTTFLMDIEASEKNKAGPADYVDGRKKQVLGFSKNVTPKLENMLDNEYQSKSRPAPNKYKPNHDSLSTSRTIFRGNMNRDTSPKATSLKRDNSPSPHHYEGADKASWEKTSKFRDVSKEFKFKTEERRNFTKDYIKSKRHVPKPYKVDIEVYDKIARNPMNSPTYRKR